MNTISRYTIQYDTGEDRIRLIARLVDGESQVLWITHRLLSRLIPHLTEWLDSLPMESVGTLDPKTERHLRDEMQRFKQHAVQQTVQKQSSLKADQQTPSWLVSTIKVRKRPSTLALEFRGVDGQELPLYLEIDALRLTLNVLFNAYKKADWPLSCWPVWMTTQTTDYRDSLELH